SSGGPTPSSQEERGTGPCPGPARARNVRRHDELACLPTPAAAAEGVRAIRVLRAIRVRRASGAIRTRGASGAGGASGSEHPIPPREGRGDTPTRAGWKRQGRRTESPPGRSTGARLGRAGWRERSITLRLHGRFLLRILLRKLPSDEVTRLVADRAEPDCEREPPEDPPLERVHQVAPRETRTRER